MSVREPRFEVVHSDAGWFARFVGANGRKVWQTESYTRRRAAVKAIASLSFAVLPQKPSGWVALDAMGDLIEVRTVDERWSE